MALSRRDFLKASGSACVMTGAGATALALLASTGCAKKTTNGSSDASTEIVTGNSEVNFSYETDILIIGTGIAGLAAGMAPAIAGKKIIYADKKSTWGGDSASSSFLMSATGCQLQLDAGYTMTADEAWEASKQTQIADFDQYAWYPEWVKGRFFANTAFVNSAIADFGCLFQAPATQEELPYSADTTILPGGGIGTGNESILAPLQSKLASLGAQFLYDLRASALIKDDTGAIIGCRFFDKLDAPIDIKATAVVLATGGFIDNGEMVAEYVSEFAPFASLVHGSMGEGHRIGKMAGAQLTGMDTTTVYCDLTGDIASAMTWGYWTPLVLVLPNGKRFVREDQSTTAANVALAAGFQEWWVIFDQRAFDNRCIGASVASAVDSHADVYRQAATVEELAAALALPVDDFVTTLTRHDEFAAAGADEDCGKEGWLASLTPPYHALKLRVRRYKTSGGLMVGGSNRVLDTKGEEMEGLYACGALTTLSYANVSTCAATGYFTGQTLASL